MKLLGRYKLRIIHTKMANRATVAGIFGLKPNPLEFGHFPSKFVFSFCGISVTADSHFLLEWTPRVIPQWSLNPLTGR